MRFWAHPWKCVHSFNLKLLPFQTPHLLRVSLHFHPLPMQRLQRRPEQKCANEAQICRHLDVDTATCCTVPSHLSVWAADRESSCLVANRHLHYLPSTHICGPHNWNHPPSATQRQTRVIALLDSCVGVKFPGSSRLNQIVQNDLNVRNRFPPGEEINEWLIKCIQHAGATQVSAQPSSTMNQYWVKL